MLLLWVLLSAAIGSAAMMGEIDPRGVYFHQFTGSFDGSEWSTIFEKPGANKFEFDDIANGLPFDTTILPDGTWTFDSAGGTGSFSDADNASFDIFVSGFSFDSQIRRVPFTTPEFPVLFQDSVAGDEALGGTWLGTLSVINPSTGGVVSSVNEDVEIDVTGEVLRMTRASGTFYAGPFEDADHVAIRALRFNSPNSNYKSFPGSTTNEFRNVLGELHITSDESIEGVLLVQTNVQFPNWVQEIIRVELSRQCLADVNGNNNVEPTDFSAWIAAFNTNHPSADQNGDGLVSSTDFTAWIANYNLGCG
jgi:hypothetical protein